MKAEFRLIIVVLFSMNRATIVLSSPESLALRDVPTKLGDAFCKADFSFQTLWSFGISDAQVEGFILRNKGGVRKVIPLDIVMTRVRKLALELGRHGYAMGHCQDGSAWATVFVSPQPLEIKNGILDLSQMKSNCAGKTSVDWVPAASGISESLAGREGRYTLPQKDGFVSVVCFDPQRGPVEAFLMPTGKPVAEVPFALPNTVSNSEQVLNILNEMRVREKRQKIETAPQLTQASQALVGDGRVGHSLEAINKESKKLQVKKFYLLGEARVRAKTLREALTLLWISPQHRDLILNSEATHGGITIKSEQDVFVQVTVARSTH